MNKLNLICALSFLMSCTVDVIDTSETTEGTGSVDTNEAEFRASLIDYPEVAGGEMCCPVIGGDQQREFCTPGTTPAQCDAVGIPPGLGITDWYLADCTACGDGFSPAGDMAWASWGAGFGYECFGKLWDADSVYPLLSQTNAYNSGDFCWADSMSPVEAACPAGISATCKGSATACQAHVFDSEEASSNWLDAGDEGMMCCKDNGSSCIPLNAGGGCPGLAAALGYTRKLICDQCLTACQGWDLVRDGAVDQVQEQLDSLQCGKKVSGNLVPMRYQCDGELYDPSIPGSAGIVRPCPASNALCID